MDGYSGIMMLQSNHPKFIECYKNMVEVVEAQEYIYHSQSCSFHKLSNNHTLILTAGYLLAKFAQTIKNIEEIKQFVKFGLLKENNTFIELNLIHLGYDDWIVSKLNSFGCEIEVGYILYLEMINNSEFKIIPKYTNSLLKQGQELITMSSPFAIQGQEMYKNYYRKAHVSQLFTDQNLKQLFMLDIISQLGQEGGSVFNSKGEYVGMILQNRQMGHLNNRYFTFCINWETINSILGKKPQILEQSFFCSKMIDYMLQVSHLARQSAGAGSCTIINDNANNKTYALTASHVLNSHLKGSQVLIGKNEITAQLLEECINDMDFALAELSTNIKGISIEEIINQKIPQVGQTVYAVGFLHRLFEFSPCLAKGSIIKLIYDNENILTAIVTDCFIHNGYSGGGLFTENGELLGIISFNIGHASEGIICDLSYITPIFPFQPIFQDLYLNKKITEKSQHLFSIKNKLAKDLRKLQTINQLPQIGYKPKL